ncbi:alpha/beta fold hydrolase [Streptomyces sp. NPDC057199]|uniref:alpha/beta fold hydrolase n=1 Tax=Streptomyces sp. NPDC057199 TaxID=3346047 RepID=UPI0036309082
MSQPLLHHRVLGPTDAPLLVLGPSLGTSTAVWNPQAVALADRYRVLCFDLPGHGGSPSDLLRDIEPAGSRIDDLGRLVLNLVDHYGREQFHYAGISLGGAIGAHLAINHPERVSSLALVCSSAHFGAPAPWHDRADLVRREGTAPLLEVTPGRWFADPDTAESSVGHALLQDLAAADPDGYAACCDILAAYDVRRDLERVTAPTCVMGGIHDTATPLSHATELADAIPGATLTPMATGHLAVEDSQAVEEALRAHLGTAGVKSG